MKAHVCKSGFGIGGLHRAALGLAADLPHFPSPAYWMCQALLQAMSSVGRACPNPQVGCVIVKNNRIIGSGTTESFGGRHAERVAVDSVKQSKDILGATVYVTLEPCSHAGKQPPCVEGLIAAGIKRCVIGLEDPFPEVAGGGIARLQESGIDVEVGVLAAECRAWHLPYLIWASKSCRRPVFFGKWAQTLDGHLADDEGSSKWITGTEARALTHWLRQKHDAIMVGAGTVLKDRPLLTVRDCPNVERQPLKIIYDPRARLSQVEYLPELRKTTFGEGKLLWLVGPEAQDLGALAELPEVLVCRLKPDLITSLPEVLSDPRVIAFWGRPIGSVFVEGGSQLLALLFDADLIDGAHCFITPGFLGGEHHRIFHKKGGQQPFLPCSSMRRFSLVSQNSLGNDILMEFVR